MFLFGPRATGKTFLIQRQLAQAFSINLLNTDLFLQLTQKPNLLEPMILAAPAHEIVVIDEVQRIPELLNEVHRLIEYNHRTFLLTGSSARKLRKQGVNLLAGRAWEARLFPLTYAEIPDFDLDKYLQYGGLPVVYNSADPREELFAYVHTYLQEEIMAEAQVRSIPAFSRFLQLAALTSGKMLNFSTLASDTGVTAVTIHAYYQLLEDTFLGFMVPAWTKTLKRKAISTAKFYLFDIGVQHTLARINSLPPQSDLFGQAFEHFMAMELRSFLSYRRMLGIPLSYWQSKHGHEVDFILGDEIAIEVKSTHTISEKHLKNLTYLSEEKICRQYFLISQDPLPRKYHHIHVLPWRMFLNQLWAGDIL